MKHISSRRYCKFIKKKNFTHFVFNYFMTESLFYCAPSISSDSMVVTSLVCNVLSFLYLEIAKLIHYENRKRK